MRVRSLRSALPSTTRSTFGSSSLSSRTPGRRVRISAAVVTAALTATFAPMWTAPASAVEVPNADYTKAFSIQTNGPNALITLGDQYSSVNGGGTNHLLKINVPCGWPKATPIQVDLFSPAVNTDPSLPKYEEPKNGGDTTQYTLNDPGGALVHTQSYATISTPTESWSRFATLPAPVGCGTYSLLDTTSDDDQNGWKLRVGLDDDGDATTAPPANYDNPDGLQGTDDEITIGLQKISYQHDIGDGTPKTAKCLTLYQYVDPTQGSIRFNNFDIDTPGSDITGSTVNTSIRYYAPSDTYDPLGQTGGIVGTRSGDGVWNNGGSAKTRGGDLINGPEVGWWRLVTCVSNNNQFIQEGVAGQPVYFDQPPTPSLQLTKSDGVTTTSTGSQLTYALTLTNAATGSTAGAAANVVVKDPLPADLTFVSCTVGGAADGSTCALVGGVVTATLKTAIAANNGTRTVNVVAKVTPGTPAPTKIDNTATASYTDSIGNKFADLTATDSDTLGTGKIGDLVFTDSNANGVQDAGEPGIVGAAVTLYAADGATVLNTTTSVAGGAYSFGGLAAGTYVVGFTKPAGTLGTAALQGGDTTKDSNPDPTSGKTGPITLANGQNDATIDAGFYALGSIGDFVFLDNNNNGTQNAADAGVAGVTVKLFKADGVTSAAPDTVTDAAGKYSFTGLVPGGYIVQFVPKSGQTIGKLDTGGNTAASDLVDSDASPTFGTGFGKTALITLASGQNNTSVDAAMVAGGGTVGDTVFNDANGNGTLDAGEVGVAGVTVNLLNAAGTTVLQTTTTNASGSYQFTGIPVATNYVVQFVAPAGSTFTTASAAAPTAVNGDSDANVATGKTAAFAVPNATAITTVDAGLVVSTSIGDKVFLDNNLNGVQDAGEPSVDGVTVNLLTSAGAFITSQVTAGGGLYTFAGLAPGTYKVQFVSPSPAQTFTLKDVGGNTVASDKVDSDADPTPGVGQGLTANIVLTSGTPNLTIDAGLVPGGSIGDLVFNDLNGNGTQDAGDLGIAGQTVTLYKADGTTVLTTTTTDVNGKYSFGSLPLNVGYVIGFTKPAGSAYSPKGAGTPTTSGTDSDADVTTGKTAVVTPTTATPILSVDAGEISPASIGDLVFNDANGNGTQDAGELGINGVTVNLLSSTGAFITSKVTAGGGVYSFTGLTPGTQYIVQFVPRTAADAFSPRAVATPTSSGTDSDADPTPGAGIGKTGLITAQSGAVTSVDAGIVPGGSIGDLVFNDVNGNGTQDASDAGIAGQTVTLYKADATTVLTTTTTDINGKYSFGSLPLNVGYVIGFTKPATSTYSPKGAGTPTTSGTDSDADTASGKTAVVTPTTSTAIVSVDAGEIAPASIGDLVFNDLNGNGTQDAGETGINGVTVNLLSSTGALIASKVTAGGGLYSFPGLTVGTQYIVQFVPSSPTQAFTTRAVATPTASGTDSDADPTPGAGLGKTGLITAQSGAITSVDAGIVGGASIGDFVFNDLNGNGTQDAGDTGISGQTVTLYKADATTVLATTTTDINGKYAFNNLPLNVGYVVGFTKPATSTYSPQGAGTPTASGTDSDADLTTGKTVAITPAVTGAITSVDAGEIGSASIGDRVFNDVNGNGTQDGGELGIDGVTVNLLSSTGAFITSKVTAGGGLYSFPGLTVGTQYVVQFVPRTAADAFSPRAVATPTTSGTDSDADPTPGAGLGKTGLITAQSGAVTSVDAGIVAGGSIGDLVFNDLNGNGIQDAGDTGISGQTVTLYKADGTTVLTTTTTDVNGKYSFGSLPLNIGYVIGFTKPATSTYSPQGAGAPTASGTDSDADLATGKTAVITPATSTPVLTVDAGEIAPASIGDLVFNDVNGNGVQDPADNGIDGVTVNLLSSTGAFITSKVTAGGGLYSFTGLTPGTQYIVQFVPLTPTQAFTTRAVLTPTTSGTDSDADPAPGAGIGKTGLITAQSGAVTSVDAGIVGGASIGDFVFNDVNGNGTQDAGDTGISGQTVTLYKADGTTVLTTTTTDVNGKYAFNNLPLNVGYVVGFTKPAGSTYSPQGAGTPTTSGTDSDADLTTGKTAVITPAAAGAITSVDAGEVASASIGDLVFNDVNGNGVQDPADTGIDGVTVNLLSSTGAFITSKVTAGGGLYSFPGLTVGTQYIVQFVPSSPTQAFTTRAVATPTTSGTDSDADPTPGAGLGKTGLITAQSGAITSVDAGIVGGASIGDFVFNDLNGNGTQDAGDAGISGQTVTLYKADGTTVLATTTTDINGKYAFNNLPLNVGYVIGFTKPAATTYSPQGAGSPTASGTDSDADLTTGKTAVITPAVAGAITSVDAGEISAASIGDLVFNDANGNGTREIGELGIDGVTVNLLSSTGAFITSKVTAGGGVYTFVGLTPGTQYIVQFVPRTAADAFSPRTVATPTTSGTDSDADPTPGAGLGKTGLITAQSGAITAVDAGIVAGGSIGDLVFNDLNGNGTQDAGDLGIAGQTVTLYKADGTTVLTTTTTDVNGKYSFGNLPLNVGYVIGFTKPAASSYSPQGAGTPTTSGTDSDADATTGKTAVISPTTSTPIVTVDAGEVAPASIGDVVFNDANGDGTQDGGELGIDGVTVNLLSSTGAFITSKVTAGGGAYAFTGLTPGTQYIVQFVPSTTTQAFSPRAVLTPTTSGTDSDADPTPGAGLGKTGLITAQSGAITSVDAGIVGGASIGDLVFNDLNGNGIQDAGDTGISGQTVTLYKADGTTVLTTTTTDINGKYAFNNLPLNTGYVVGFAAPGSYSPKGAGADNTKDSDVNPSGKTDVITPTVSGAITTVDAGEIATASIGDLVFNDVNGNGIQDASDTGIDGVTVRLLSSTGAFITSKVTAGGGLYSFPNLTAGTQYIVEFVPPTDKAFSPKLQGGDSAKDSDADPTYGSATYGRTALITAQSGVSDTSIDAGLVPGGSIGDLIFTDVNGNGIQDAGDTGVVGQTVTLYKADGTTVIGSTLTDVNGKYAFNSLPLNTGYVVGFSSAGSYSPKGAGTDPTLDSDVNPTGKTDVITPTTATPITSVDAGELALGSIGNVVFNDVNGNGLQDAGDTPAANVTVHLFKADGVTSAAPDQITDGAGLYSFTGLAPGQYVVQFVAPNALTTFTTKGAGADPTKDSDASTVFGAGFGKTGLITVVSGTNDTSIDAGLVPAASLGDLVFNDQNGNGIQDAGDTGIAGQTVTLYKADGTTVLATTTTDPNGKYAFNNLPLNTGYVIGFSAPGSYSLKGAGADPTKDSDVNATGKTDVITPTTAVANTSIDAGEFGTGSIGDLVFNDVNGNGIQDAADTGVLGITVKLFKADGVTSAAPDATTDNNGTYSFTGLAPGQYVVRFVAPGRAFSPQGVGGDPTKDSDASSAPGPNVGTTGLVTVTSGVANTSVDAGLVPSGAIGDLVFVDHNGNGIQDAADGGLGGVTVKLFASDGTTLLQTATSASTGVVGSYAFTDLPPATYVVQFVLPTTPAGQVFSPTGQGTTATDSNPNASGLTTVVLTTAAPSDQSVDAGIVPLTSPPVAVDDSYTTLVNTPKTFDPTANDSDPAGEQLTITVKTDPTHGTVVCTTTGTTTLVSSCTYTPNNGYVGSDAFDYTITNTDGKTASATDTITITAAAQPPVAVNDSYSTPVNTPKTFDPTSNDSDPAGEQLTITVKTNPTHGTVVCTTTGTTTLVSSCTYTPNNGYTGTDAFDYTITNTDGKTATATVTITITGVTPPVDKAPVAVDDTVTTPQDTAVSTQVLENDTDPDAGDVLTVLDHTDPAHGTVACDNTITVAHPHPTCTYTPTPGYSGTDTYDYTVSDGHGMTDVGTVHITVTPTVNQPPAFNGNPDQTIPVGGVPQDVTATDPENDPITFAVPTPAQLPPGLGLDSGGHWTGTASTPGVYPVTITITDGHHPPVSTTITITVVAAATGNPPVAKNDKDETPNNTPVTTNVLTNDTDPDAGDTLTIVGHTNPASGSVTCSATTCTYTPTATFQGDVTYTYTISDGHGNTSTATVTVTVDDAPPVYDGSKANTAQTIPVGSKPAPLSATDANNDPLTYAVQDPTKLPPGITLNPDGTFKGAASAPGTYTIVVVVDDGHNKTDVTTLVITVTGSNLPPDAVNDTATTPATTPVSISVLGNDTDPNGDPLTLTASTQPGHGTVSCTPAGACTYTPASGFTGTDTFTYTISDGHGGTDTATVTVTVTPANAPPVAGPDSATTLEDTPVAISVLGNDTDPDGDTVTFVGVATQPTHGTVSCTGAGVCTYTPNPNVNGTDSFTYTVTDGHDHTTVGTVTVTVTPVNDPPKANPDKATTSSGTPVVIPVLPNDTDPDGDPLTVTTTTDPKHGTVTCTATGACTYTPDAGFTGVDTFTYTITDGKGGTSTTTVTVTVTNQPPVATPDTITVLTGTPTDVPVLGNDTDPDSDPLTIVTHSDPPHGTVTCNATTCTYTSDPGYTGPDTYTYTISDGHGHTKTTTVTVTVDGTDTGGNGGGDNGDGTGTGTGTGNPSSGGGGLPFTGAPLSQLATAAGAMLLLGLMLVLVGRKPQRARV